MRGMLEASAPECPWCSTPFAPGQPVCSSCGANLAADEKSEIPGVTEVDKAAIGVARPPTINSRSRWRAWISGDSSDTLTANEAKAVAPPDVAVRQEMLRLELQAHVARLQAEAEALLAEAAEEGRAIDIPPELLSSAMAEPGDAAAEPVADEAPADAGEPSPTVAESAASVEPASVAGVAEPATASASAPMAETSEADSKG